MSQFNASDGTMIPKWSRCLRNAVEHVEPLSPRCIEFMHRGRPGAAIVLTLGKIAEYGTVQAWHSPNSFKLALVTNWPAERNASVIIARRLQCKNQPAMTWPYRPMP